MHTLLTLCLVIVSTLFHPTVPYLHPSSPCPSVFSYEGSEPEADRWYGEIVITTREHLLGVRLNILLDRRAYLMVSWLGEVTSSDNKEFTILNLEERLDPKHPLTTRVMLRFDTVGGSPKVKTIYLNGKQICPGEPPIQVNALNKNSSKPSSTGLKRPDPIFTADTVYNPTATTYDDYYSEFFNINQQNASKRKPDKVYANTESSVPETGYPKPHKPGNKGAHKPAQTDNNYSNTQSNTDFVKPLEQSYSNSNQGSEHVMVVQTSKKKIEDSEYVQSKPTYTDTDSYVRPQSNTDEYSNYNPRPQTSGSNYNRPQSSDSSYNARPQTNSESNYNARPQSNTDSTYNTRPQQTYENSFDTNSRPQSSSSYNGGSSYSGASSSSYNPSSSSSNGYNSVSRPAENSNFKPQTSYVDSYRPQESSEDGYVPQSSGGNSYQTSGTSYNQNKGNNGYIATNANSRPSSNTGQNTQTQTGDISDIAEHLIEDGDTNKTVIITVIKHNAQESTTEAHKATTSSSRQKSTSKPNTGQNENKNTGSSQGQPLNTQHNQKRPTEQGNKKQGANSNSNGQSGNSNKNVQCGSVVYNKAQPLVTNGQKTARGQWPWHAALYKTEGINLSYICGGSLVTANYVITAAHCVTKKPYDKPVDSDTLVIYLGKYHQHQFSDEGGVQNKQVQKIHVYPTYNSSNYLGDVALLRLSSEVDYSSYVRPVCLWDESSAPLQLSAVEGLDGTVIGWGYDENDRVSEELKMAIMPIVSHQQCLWSNPQFFSQFTSDETFCAGFRNGESALGHARTLKWDGTLFILSGTKCITLVIGWGFDENNRVTEELKMAQMPVVSNEQCLWSYPQFFSQFTSDVTYCAGFRNGTSVCNGDSGGGMVFKMESTWYLRGIVSITVARDGLRICDTKHYVVFTDVAKYLAWVRPLISGQ